jgi:prepilin-type N-terminal cleavage/methylation domain-containing protein
MRSPRRRAGFTFVEVLVVFVLFGLIAAMAAPHFDYMRSASNVRSAKDQLAAYVTVARAASIRRGKPAEFHASGNSMWVTVDSSGTQVSLARTVYLDSTFKVTLTPPVPVVRFDSRGFSSLAASQNFVIARDAVSDTVCVTRVGIIIRKGCTI